MNDPVGIDKTDIGPVGDVNGTPARESQALGVIETGELGWKPISTIPRIPGNAFQPRCSNHGRPIDAWVGYRVLHLVHAEDLECVRKEGNEIRLFTLRDSLIQSYLVLFRVRDVEMPIGWGNCHKVLMRDLGCTANHNSVFNLEI
jgi:hypothetical protein